MGYSGMLQKKERLSQLVILFTTLMGIWIFLQFGVWKLTPINEPMIFVLLAVFLLIVECFPMPVWRGSVSISFSLIYVILLMEGPAYTIVSLGLIVGIVNLIKRRPVRIIFFNPASLLVSIELALHISQWIYPSLSDGFHSSIMGHLIHFNLFMFTYYVINNIIIDMVLLIRPQNYSFKAWRRKTLQEINGYLVSFCYLTILFILGSQNRGQIDAVTFFFFFSPLVCIALLSSIISNLKKEKAKLKALFSISSELNKKIAFPDWLTFLTENLHEIIDVDSWSLWKKEKEHWQLQFATGLVKGDMQITEDMARDLEKIDQVTVYHRTKVEAGPVGVFFTNEVASLIYAPLILENEMVGLFVFGRTRARSFEEDEVQSAATLANQLAVLIKTKWLFAEQEKRMILEERNRIAREIHDGVAQSLAGAIMNLETAQRKFARLPEESLHLMTESTEKLRLSLKEVRQSIYALRPYPTERVGLQSAISKRINMVKRETNIGITFESRGPEFQLSPMVEKIIFDIGQESIQNALKHAEATKIDILLSYQKENVFLKIKDNGKGFSLFQAMIRAREHPHFGILQMNEAAERIQASLQVDSKEGAGTEITLTVPRMGIEGSDLHDKAYASR